MDVSKKVSFRDKQLEVINSAIKNDVFMPYIESCIFNVESLKNRKAFYFGLQLLSQKYA